MGKRRLSPGKRFLLWVLSPVLLIAFLVVLPFVLLYVIAQNMYRVFLRVWFELTLGARGRRILLVYSSSPNWQTHIESVWVPRLEPHVAGPACRYNCSGSTLATMSTTQWWSCSPRAVESEWFVCFKPSGTSSMVELLRLPMLRGRSSISVKPWSRGVPNYGVNPTAGGRRSLSSRVWRAPAAGYTER
jgi:hypothetical protein